MIELWSINRWLRWTGFVFIVETSGPPEALRKPTRVGVRWIGLSPERAWDRHCAKTLALHTDCSETPPDPGDTAPSTVGAE